MAFFTDTHTTTPGLFAGLGAYFARLRRSYADAREFRRTYNELSALSDRELTDLGLSRWDIANIARKTVYGE